MITTKTKLRATATEAYDRGDLDGRTHGIKLVGTIIELEVLNLDNRRKEATTRWEKRRIEGGLESLLDLRALLLGDDES